MELTYRGDGERTYLFPGHLPVTVENGDTAEIPYDPEDGCWSPPETPKPEARNAPETKEA